MAYPKLFVLGQYCGNTYSQKLDQHVQSIPAVSLKPSEEGRIVELAFPSAAVAVGKAAVAVGKAAVDVAVAVG